MHFWFYPVWSRFKVEVQGSYLTRLLININFISIIHSFRASFPLSYGVITIQLGCILIGSPTQQ